MNAAPPPDDAAAETAGALLFEVFVHLADAGQALAARDVQALFALMEEPAWAEPGLARAAVAALRRQYASLWKAWQAAGAVHGLPAIAARIDALAQRAGGPSRDEVAAVVRRFAEQWERRAAPLGARLGLVPSSPARLRARQDLEAVLRGQGHAPTAAPPAAAGDDDDRPDWPAARLAPEAQRRWPGGRLTVRCLAVVPETHDVRTFVFQATEPMLFSYAPGQFVSVDVPVDGQRVRRSYTISSSPSRPYAISITVKRGGRVSAWLHDHVQPGTTLGVSGPHGDFSCLAAPARRLLLLAAGSGITPIMSMLRWLVDTATDADVVVLNNVRTPADIVFERELQQLAAQRTTGLRIHVVPSTVPPGQAWPGPTGRLDAALLHRLVPDAAGRETFVCGPKPYMDVARAALLAAGLPARRFHQESFGGAPPAGARRAPVPAAAAAPACDPGDGVEVVFARSGTTLRAAAGEFILDVAEAHGIAWPSSCRSGSCGTCRIRKLEGEVDVDGMRALGEGDLLDGYVLACIGALRGRRLVLDG